MANPYYNSSGTPVYLSRGNSSNIDAEYDLVAAGFDGAYVAILARGSIAGQVWTGAQDFTGATITVPTLAYGSTGSYAVSVDMLNAAVFAAANLPAQTGNANNALFTDGTTPFWGAIGMTRSVRTSNTVIALTDNRSFVDITSGTFSQTFGACAALGTSFYMVIRNSGTGDVTLEPDGAELIDGLTNFIMYPGEARIIQGNGTALTSIVLQGFIKTFTSSGTFTKPPGYSKFVVKVSAGGGGGGSGSKLATSLEHSGGGGGGSGGIADYEVAASIVGATETVTVGAGGTGGAAITVDSTPGNAGTAGGNSSFGAVLGATGGGGGGGGVNGGPSSAGTAGTGYPTTYNNGQAGGVGSHIGQGAPGSAASSTAAGSGGAGGGVSNFPTAFAGGAGGATGSATVGYRTVIAGGTAGAVETNGGAGNAGPLGIGGSGGGGGGASITATNAGSGGAGAGVGSGGGGGGASADGASRNSGAGAAGRDGAVIIYGV